MFLLLKVILEKFHHCWPKCEFLNHRFCWSNHWGQWYDYSGKNQPFCTDLMHLQCSLEGGTGRSNIMVEFIPPSKWVSNTHLSVYACRSKLWASGQSWYFERFFFCSYHSILFLIFFSIGKYSSQETVHLLYQLDGKLFNSMFLFLL